MVCIFVDSLTVTVLILVLRVWVESNRSIDSASSFQRSVGRGVGDGLASKEVVRPR